MASIPTFSDPTCSLMIDNWPIGRTGRCKVKFHVETGKRGERVVRQTSRRDGTYAKPKKLTYSRRQAIVTGDDGRTYILCESFRSITVFQGDMKYTLADGHFMQEYDQEQFLKLRALIDSRDGQPEGGTR